MALTAVQVKQAKPKGKAYKLFDEKGLYLLVNPNGSKYWRHKFRFGGKEKVLALGVFPEVSLAEAREGRDEARRDLRNGIDPSQKRRSEKLAAAHAGGSDFSSIAREWFETRLADKSESHRSRAWGILSKNLFPKIGHRPVGDIDAQELLLALRAIESRGAIDLAHRARATAGQVFRYAIATGRASRDPSSDLRGALKSRNPKHFAAITDPKELGKLLIAIDSYSGGPVVKTALKLSALLFQRPGEIRSMRWEDINWDEYRWEIPGSKMKSGRDHIVPLPTQALELLAELQRVTGRTEFVFPSERSTKRPLSENGVRVALRTMGYSNEQMTAHGFRATARTLLDEVLGYRVDYIEHQLAHAVKDATGRAYNRTSHLKERATMVQEWADYLDNLKAQAKTETVITACFGR